MSERRFIDITRISRYVLLRRSITLCLIGTVLASCTLACSVPYSRPVLLLEPAQGIEPGQTKGWRWSGCPEAGGVPNVYRISRPSYRLILVHSAEAHGRPEFLLGASTLDGRALDIDGPAIREGRPSPINSSVELGTAATYQTFLPDLPGDGTGVLTLHISGKGVDAHEQLKYRLVAIKCSEREGP